MTARDLVVGKQLVENLERDDIADEPSAFGICNSALGRAIFIQ